MNSKYNVLINYKGEGEFKFAIRRIGEVSITRDKPVYIYNADVETINNLRQLRRMLIEITIGTKPDGAFKVLNLEDYKKDLTHTSNQRFPFVEKAEAVSNNEVKSILSSGSSGPIEIEEDKIVSITPTDDAKDEEVVEEVKVTKPKRTTKKSSSKKKTSKK